MVLNQFTQTICKTLSKEKYSVKYYSEKRSYGIEITIENFCEKFMIKYVAFLDKEQKIAFEEIEFSASLNNGKKGIKEEEKVYKFYMDFVKEFNYDCFIPLFWVRDIPIF